MKVGIKGTASMKIIIFLSLTSFGPKPWSGNMFIIFPIFRRGKHAIGILSCWPLDGKPANIYIRTVEFNSC